MGRTSALKFSDITCRYPDALPVLTNLCELARIAEVNAEEMYLHKSESLQLLYVAAERTHGQLRRFAEKAGIGSSDVGSQGGQYGGSPALHLHNGNAYFSHTRASTANPPTVYYHSILLTFRPFLVTEALAGNRQKQGAMWLREACRHATDAAQDSLVFINNELDTTASCKVSTLRCLTINIHRPHSRMFADSSPGLEIHSILHRIELRRAALRQPVASGQTRLQPRIHPQRLALPRQHGRRRTSPQRPHVDPPHDWCGGADHRKPI
jgi:hypothetical protein